MIDDIASSVLPSRSSTATGIVRSSSAGMKRPRKLCQKRLATNFSSHHVRHRPSVRRSTPRSSFSRRARNALTPCCIAVASTTTAPR